MLLSNINILKIRSSYLSSVFIRSFFEKYRSGDLKYERVPEKDDKPYFWHMKNGFNIAKRETTLWLEEFREDLRFDPKSYNPGDTDIFWKFNNNEDLSKWIVTSDKSNEDGHSDCSLSLTKYNYGLFQGTLSTVLPKDGRISRAGYCNITNKKPNKSFMRKSYYELKPFTHLAMRFRGDGRSYGLNLLTPGFYDINWHDTYNFVLYTRGGPYWQTAKVPFSKFLLSSKGRIQDKQGPVPWDRVHGIGITCADQNPGPFSLEIDYIGLHWDPNHTEEFAYELYQWHKLQLY